MSEHTLADQPARVNAMDLALEFIKDGTLRLSAEGYVWRCKSNGRNVAWRRAERVDSKGYLRITLGVPMQKRTCHVQAHCLIWRVAKGPIPEGMQINHKDLDKTNNRLGNLELVTGAENIQHSYANGRTRPYANTSTKAKALKADVDRMRAAGAQYKDISAALGISISHAHRIANRKEVERGEA